MNTTLALSEHEEWEPAARSGVKWSENRRMWAANRFWMESQNLVNKQYGGKRKQHWYAMLLMMQAAEAGLRLAGLYERGREHAQDVRLREVELTFPSLPTHFDGLSLLHISDPHFDGSPGVDEAILRLARGRTFDLCLYTGDYRAAVHGPHRGALAGLENVARGIDTREGSYAVLGNHDDCHMVEPIERLGVRMLINESVTLQRGNQVLRLLGTDDVHYYYTDQALLTLERARDDFSIALVHSPELYRQAAEAGVDLYLCGHTHAGQICLPGGAPLIKHIRSGRSYFRGTWTYAGMTGITSSGVGTSGIPVRYNTRGEIVAITLRRGNLGRIS